MLDQETWEDYQKKLDDDALSSEDRLLLSKIFAESSKVKKEAIA